MATTLELLDGVRFFENAIEIVAVSAAYAETYKKTHTFITREIVEYKTLSAALATGKALCCHHDAINLSGKDA
ncbi:hypothetical protein [uncultured Photobacterium sp.]|uniref:hypothetical protein n=1 Tax=uncultured Photobacterium sp. TaxID=173973 RepID=UPI0026253851|nr:hypothetical protein [uncultured Photobacterium sp.]